MPLLGPIPGYAEAVERETFDRLAIYEIDEESILGLAVRSLTPRLAYQLELASSPLLTGKIPEPWDLYVFLWHLMAARRQPVPGWAKWTFGEKWFREMQRRALEQWILAQDFQKLALAIQSFVSEALSDGPGETGGNEGPPVASWVSGVVDYVASRYGWSESAILDMPLKRLWQYWRRGRMRDTEGEAVFINRISDRIRADFVAQLQKQPERQKEGA